MLSLGSGARRRSRYCGTRDRRRADLTARCLDELAVLLSHRGDGEALDVEQRIALVLVARSPIERLVALKKQRGWQHLRLYSDVSGDFTRDYVSADDADVPAFNVFTRRDGSMRHFWSGEMGSETADPGQDPRGAPDLMPLWTILDTTPEGRGSDWYPKLHYAKS